MESRRWSRCRPSRTAMERRDKKFCTSWGAASPRPRLFATPSRPRRPGKARHRCKVRADISDKEAILTKDYVQVPGFNFSHGRSCIRLRLDLCGHADSGTLMKSAKRHLAIVVPLLLATAAACSIVLARAKPGGGSQDGIPAYVR